MTDRALTENQSSAGIIMISATIDIDSVRDLLRRMPRIEHYKPMAAFKVGPMLCDTIDDVWAILKHQAAEERETVWLKMKDFAP